MGFESRLPPPSAVIFRMIEESLIPQAMQIVLGVRLWGGLASPLLGASLYDSGGFPAPYTFTSGSMFLCTLLFAFVPASLAPPANPTQVSLLQVGHHAYQRRGTAMDGLRLVATSEAL